MKITAALLKPWHFAATNVVDDRSRSTKLIRSAKDWLAEDGARLGDLRDDLATLIRLVSAWRSGRYKQVPRGTIIKVLLAIGYVVSPIDLIPDYIPGIGYHDDVAVLKWLMRSIADDLEEFAAWERSKKARGAGRPGAGPRRKPAAPKKKK